MPLKPELGGFGESLCNPSYRSLTRSRKAQPVWSVLAVWVLEDGSLSGAVPLRSSATSYMGRKELLAVLYNACTHTLPSERDEDEETEVLT
jgi:hypothetical protein